MRQPLVFTPGVNDQVMDPANMEITTGENDPIGGQKSLGLAVMIGHKGRIRPDVDWVTIRVREEKDDETDPQHPIEHPFAQNHVDYTFDLNSPSWRMIKITAPHGGGTSFVYPGAQEGLGSPKSQGPDEPDTSSMFWTRVTGVPGDPSRYTNVGWNTTGPVSTPDPDGEGPFQGTTLLGHNGKHTVHIVAFGGTSNGHAWSQSESDDGGQSVGQLPFQQKQMFTDGWQDQDASSEPQTLKRDVQNLVITKVTTSNGTVDYFKFDPNSDDSSLYQPKINFTVSDKGDSHQYKWTIFFAKTADVHKIGDSSNWKSVAHQISGVVSQPGNVVVDMTDESYPEHMTAETYAPSLYTYDIQVSEYQDASNAVNGATPLDFDEFKLPYMLWIPQSFMDSNGQQKSGHSVWTVEDSLLEHTDIYANYYLFPNKAPNSADPTQLSMTAVDGNLNEKATISGPTSRGVLHNGDDGQGYRVYSTQDQDESGEWRVVFTAEDPSGKILKRNHVSQRMIPVNEVKWVHKYRDLSMQRVIALCFDKNKGGMPLLYPNLPSDQNVPYSAGRYFERSVRNAVLYLPKNGPTVYPTGLGHGVTPDSSLPVLHVEGIDPLGDTPPGKVDTYPNTHFVEIKARSSNNPVSVKDQGRQIYGLMEWLHDQSDLAYKPVRPGMTLIGLSWDQWQGDITWTANFFELALFKIKVKEIVWSRNGKELPYVNDRSNIRLTLPRWANNPYGDVPAIPGPGYFSDYVLGGLGGYRKITNTGSAGHLPSELLPGDDRG